MNQQVLTRSVRWEKFSTLFLLGIPLFLMAIYQPLDNTFLDLLNIKQWKGSSLPEQLLNVTKDIDQNIEYLKVEVNEVSAQKECPRFLKVSEQQKIKQQTRLFNSVQFCDHLVDRYFQQIYVTIIFQKDPGNISKFKLAKFEEKIFKKTGIVVKISEQILDASILPQQMKDKKNDSFYINTIAAQFSNMKYSKHCRYSNKKCENLIVIISDWDILSNGFYQVGKVVFSHPSNYQLTILQILTQGAMSLNIWSNVIRIRNLESIKKQLTNAQNLHNNFMIQVQQSQLTQYLKQIRKYLNNGSQLPPSLLSSSRAVRTDLFPSEYKLGIYLPIILIMIIFPCVNVLKI